MVFHNQSVISYDITEVTNNQFTSLIMVTAMDTASVSECVVIIGILP